MHSQILPSRRQGFTLVELLTVVAIIVSVMAVSAPFIYGTLRETRMANAIARLQVGLQQTQALLADYRIGDRAGTYPAIANAKFTGTALVVRWDDVQQDYEVFYALCNQGATKSTASGDYLVTQADPTDPAGKAWCLGYGRLADQETMTLGSGIRVAGLRANTSTASGLELVRRDSGNPCVSSFVLCMDPTGVGIPPARQVYVNLQVVPPSGGSGPWNVWDTTSYDDAGATTGSHASIYQPPSAATGTGVGECFATSLPVVIVYHDDNLPLSGNSPSGAPWRIPDAAGDLRLNPAVDPNELLAQTKGRLVYLTIQGGQPVDY